MFETVIKIKKTYILRIMFLDSNQILVIITYQNVLSPTPKDNSIFRVMCTDYLPTLRVFSTNTYADYKQPG